MAMSTRWRMPPDSSCGYCRARSAGSSRPTRSSSSSTRARIAVAVALAVQPEDLADLHADRAHRVERRAGILRHEADLRAADCCAAASASSAAMSTPVERGSRRRRRGRPPGAARAAACAVVDLPEPDSPTSATTSPSPTSKPTPWTTSRRAGAGARTRRAGPATLEDAHRVLLPIDWLMRLALSTTTSDDEAGQRREPPRGRDVVAALGDEQAPLRRRRRRAVAEEAERRDREDRGAELQGGEPDDGGERVGQHVPAGARRRSVPPLPNAAST